jgi:hypothetical protein
VRQSRPFTALVKGREYDGRVFIDAVRVLEAPTLEMATTAHQELSRRLERSS